MKLYTFNFTLTCAATIEAESEEEARRIMAGFWHSDAMPLKIMSDEYDHLEGEWTMASEPTLGETNA